MSKIVEEFGIHEALKKLGVKSINNGSSTGSDNFSTGEELSSYSPVDGALIAKVRTTSAADYEKVMDAANKAFKIWRTKPAPQRLSLIHI